MVDIKLACVFLASGHSKRFGSDKLLHPVDGVPMSKRAFMSLPAGVFDYLFAVTRSENVAYFAREVDITTVVNPDKTDDMSITIRLGIEALPRDTDACMFLVCDQPYLTSESIERLARAAKGNPGKIYALSYNGERGNPVVFPRSLFTELLRLPPKESGRYVINRHKELLILVEACYERELEDLDELP